MPDLINTPDYVFDRVKAHGFFDDFDHFVTADRWTLTADPGGSGTVLDAAGGVIQLTGDGTDADEAYLHTTHELFKIDTDKPMSIAARLKVTEANTDAAIVCFGVAQEAAADLMLDGAGGPATTLDGAMFYKVDGGTKWSVISSNATTQTKTDTEHVLTSAAWQSLRIDIIPTGTEAEVIFYVDLNGGTEWNQCRRDGSNTREPRIKHTVTISGLLEMHAVLGVKNGSANAEALDIDWVSAWQKR